MYFIKVIYKKCLPDSVKKIIKNIYAKRFLFMSTRKAFSIVYRNNLWGKDPGMGDFCSGSGSLSPNIALYQDLVNKIIEEKNIRSICDVGCGDFRVMKGILNALNNKIKYTGIDIVPPLIEHHKATFSSEYINFQCLNAVEDPLLSHDLIIIRQVLQHLSNKQIHKILSKLKLYKYALITEHIPIGNEITPNADKAQGPGTRLDNLKPSGVFIDKPPFNIPAETVLEYCDENRPNRDTIIRTYLVDISKI